MTAAQQRQPRNTLERQLVAQWNSPRFNRLRSALAAWRELRFSGLITLFVSTLLATLLIVAFDRSIVESVNPGLIYLPMLAMVAYYWQWYLGAAGALLQLLCVYFFFLKPYDALKVLNAQNAGQLLILAAVMGFVLALVQLASFGRANAEQAAARFEALNRIGATLTSELDEARVLHTIAETACHLTGAGFAAFTLRPINETGEPLVPSKGNLFRLAAVVGVTPQQEEALRRMSLGGEGLLTPIFHDGVSVRVNDALDYTQHGESMHGRENKGRPTGIPRGHPIVRSFLGAPLLDRAGNVRGGLLLGHDEPGRFTDEDEQLLVGLAAEAAIALENARLYGASQARARELDAIFESIADGITLIDEQGAVLRENLTARHLREQVETHQEPAMHERSVSGAEGDEDICKTGETLLQEVATRAQAGKAEQEKQITIADDAGDARQFVISASPLHPTSTSLVPDGGVLADSGNPNRLGGSVVVWHDVTEAHRLLVERQAHAETEARRSLLQTVIDELPGSVYLVRGQDARLVLGNRAAWGVWGATWTPGQPMAEFLEQNGIRIFHIDGRPLERDEFATLRAVQYGESIRYLQEIIRHKDGTSLPVLVNAVALDSRVLGWNGESGALEHEPAAIVVHQDVTALKEAEHIKDEFIGIAAHELRTPLAVIKGFAQMLITQTARGKGPALADWQAEAIQDIDQATKRLVELTEDLLDVTRLQAGRLELHPEPTDLVALVKRITARFKVTTSNHKVSTYSLQENLIVDVDPRRIEQVVSNLLNNAIKYSPDGGEVAVEMREDTAGCAAILSVKDSGIGIPTQQQGRIFGRFARADNARDSNIGGTGLGLYLCRELIERHNGRIWFESSEGAGSTFFVSLPLAALVKPEL